MLCAGPPGGTIGLGEGISLARSSLREDDPVRIGRYRLTARLGSGGMGVVYLGVAEDGSLVAVKVLRPELADDPQFRRRFRGEVSSLTRIRGVCTVRVIEADTESSRPFMVTEYADGPTLGEYVEERGPLSADMLYGLAAGLAEALTMIHAAGIVHRDLKPSNVIMTGSRPKVIDFGIAQTLDATSVTKTGVWVGSAGFMAPEQVLERGRPGPAADIFVWAVTILYAATGELPFGSGPTEGVLYRVVNNEPDIAGLPESLEPLVKAALAKEPQYRPAAHELLDRLTNVSAPPSTSIQPGRIGDSPTEMVLSLTWLAGPIPASRRGPVSASQWRRAPLCSSPRCRVLAPRGLDRQGSRRGPVSRGMATMGVAALAVVAVVILSVALLTGHSAKTVSPAANQGSQPNQTCPLRPSSPRITGSSSAASSRRSTASSPRQHDRHDGLADQRRRRPPAVLRLADGGATWQLAPVQLPAAASPRSGTRPRCWPAVLAAGWQSASRPSGPARTV